MGLREDFEKWAQSDYPLAVAPDGQYRFPATRNVWAAYQAASLAAAEKVKEGAARVYEVEADSWVAWHQAGAAKRQGAKAIRAIDVKKLLEQN